MTELTGNTARDRLIADRENAPWGPAPDAPDSIPTLTRLHMINDEMPLDERVRQAAQSVEDFVDAGRQRLEQAGEKLESRIDARLADLDDRGTKEINRWGGKQWAQAIGGLVLIVALSFFAGRATADEIATGHEPGYGCPTDWVDADTGGTITAATMTVRCQETAEDGADASSDDG